MSLLKNSNSNVVSLPFRMRDAYIAAGYYCYADGGSFKDVYQNPHKAVSPQVASAPRASM